MKKNHLEDNNLHVPDEGGSYHNGNSNGKKEIKTNYKKIAIVALIVVAVVSSLIIFL